jgi:hypothetical protein
MQKNIEEIKAESGYKKEGCGLNHTTEKYIQSGNAHSANQ